MIGQRARESREFPRDQGNQKGREDGNVVPPRNARNTATLQLTRPQHTYIHHNTAGRMVREAQGKWTVGTCLTLPPRISQPAGHPKPSRPVPREARLSTPPPQPAGRVLLVRYCEACSVCRMYVPRATANGVAAWA
jgi:hypothetical protein